MNDLEKEKENLIEQYKSRFNTVLNGESELQSLINQSWSLNLICFEKKDTECIEAYDDMRLRLQYIYRHRRAHEHFCKNACFYTSIPDMQKMKPKTSKNISDLKRSIVCLETCDEKSIFLLKEETTLIKDGINNFAEFLKNE